MAAHKKFVNNIRRTVRRMGGKIWSGILYVWNRPILISGVLLVLAVFLFNLLIKETFKPYTNCSYLIVNQLGMDSFFCNGHTVTAFGSTIFTIPGLKGVMDPPLELVRSVIAWSVVLFFAFISLFLTIMIDHLKFVVRLVSFNKEEWKKFMARARIWLFLFVGFCAVFYFTVIK
jgi:hypothetical protein